jgi:putative chitinase
MRKISRKVFFDGYRREFKRLNQAQVEAIEDLLFLIEADEDLSDVRQIAYVLATILHETAATYRPIEEYGKGKGRVYGKKDPVTGHAYYGRGFVQLTWKKNYSLLGKKLGVDLVNKPALSMKPDIAWQITTLGMREGLFTGKKLDNYISDDKTDYVNARRIINGTDRAQLIAGYAEDFEKILTEAQVERAESSILSTDIQHAVPAEASPVEIPPAQPAPIAVPPIEQPQQTNESGASGTQVVVNPNAEATPVVSTPFTEAQKIVKDNSGKLMNLLTGGSVLGVIGGFVKDNAVIVIAFALAVVVLGLTIYFVNRYMKVLEAKSAMNPAQYPIQFVSADSKEEKK